MNDMPLSSICILPPLVFCSFLTHAPEADFQVTKPGKWRDVCEGSATVILGVTSSVPSLPLPNVLLMANVTWPQGPFTTWSTPGDAPVINLSRKACPSPPKTRESNSLTAWCPRCPPAPQKQHLKTASCHPPSPASPSCCWRLSRPVAVSHSSQESPSSQQTGTMTLPLK
ncbi:FAM71F2 isoform 6 [Pongo abelii]|uniref:FAM71F2 isoform 6 n=1 Tax=Pongo abelii TaxID=9601 RepID=A0A2J8U4L4_PONAB|nr:FAM71F2 isoform 6 [Pongo abelii]